MWYKHIIVGFSHDVIVMLRWQILDKICSHHYIAELLLKLNTNQSISWPNSPYTYYCSHILLEMDFSSRMSSLTFDVLLPWKIYSSKANQQQYIFIAIC